MTSQLSMRMPDGSSQLLKSDAQHQFRRIEPTDFQPHAAGFRKCHPEIAVWLGQIPCSRLQIPCFFEIIPCSVAQGIPLETYDCARLSALIILQIRANFTKLPVLFPVSRENGNGDRFDEDCVRHHAVPRLRRFPDKEEKCGQLADLLSAWLSPKRLLWANRRFWPFCLWSAEFRFLGKRTQVGEIRSNVATTARSDRACGIGATIQVEVRKDV
jgi:hypothetical protein